MPARLWILIAVGMTNGVVHARGYLPLVLSLCITALCIFSAFELGKQTKKKRVRFATNLVQEHRI